MSLFRPLVLLREMSLKEGTRAHCSDSCANLRKESTSSSKGTRRPIARIFASHKANWGDFESRSEPRSLRKDRKVGNKLVRRSQAEKRGRVNDTSSVTTGTTRVQMESDSDQVKPRDTLVGHESQEMEAEKEGQEAELEKAVRASRSRKETTRTVLS